MDMQIKRQIVFGMVILLLSTVGVCVAQVLYSRKVNSELTPAALVDAIQKEGFVIQAVGTMEHCTGPLKCGVSNVVFETCAGDDCISGYGILYSSSKEARYIASTVNEMDCLIGMQALRRGRLVLGIPCDSSMAEKISRVFQTFNR